MGIDNYIATLMGCAAGDALGMPVESWKPEQIRKYVGKVDKLLAPVTVLDKEGRLVESDEFGRLKYWGFKQGAKIGFYTDDTILTLAIADSIIEKKYLDLADIAKKHIQAYDERQKPGVYSGGFGGATKQAIENLRNGSSPHTSGIEKADGTGPVMKIAPIGLYMAQTCQSEKDVREGIRFAASVGKITHRDPAAVAAAGVQAYAVYLLASGATFYDGKKNFVKNLRQLSGQLEEELTAINAFEPGKNAYVDPESLTSKLAWIEANPEISDKKAHDFLKSSSKAIHAYPFAIFMFQKYWQDISSKCLEKARETAIEGLIETVNWGGDCDTTGAIYGALAGARLGQFWPESWQIQDWERIKNTAEALYAIRPKGLFTKGD